MYIALKSIFLIKKSCFICKISSSTALQQQKIILACITLNDGRGQLKSSY